MKIIQNKFYYKYTNFSIVFALSNFQYILLKYHIFIYNDLLHIIYIYTSHNSTKTHFYNYHFTYVQSTI